MDPNETLRTALYAMINKERELAVDSLRNLANWLEKGGFVPDITTGAVEDGRRIFKVKI